MKSKLVAGECCVMDAVHASFETPAGQLRCKCFSWLELACSVLYRKAVAILQGSPSACKSTTGSFKGSKIPPSDLCIVAVASAEIPSFDGALDSLPRHH